MAKKTVSFHTPQRRNIAVKDNSNKTDPQVFWGEITPCDHVVQIYADDAAFLDSLATFIADGLDKGESTVIIATPVHRFSLEFRLRALGIDLVSALLRDRYIVLDAEETLSNFMVNGWPDEILFERLIGELLARARRNGKRVRAFGEMVALLWAKGLNGATVRLEHLWSQFCHRETFALFCAYPRTGFTQDMDASLQEICLAHSKVIPAIVPPHPFAAARSAAA